MNKLGAALVLASLTLSGAVAAQERESATRSAARSLGTSGVEAYEDGRYEQASDELEKAYTILRAPSLGLWSARALVKRKLLVQAAERYLETTGLQVPTGDAAIQKKAIEEAKSELAALGPTIPVLKVRVLGAPLSEVQVSVDGSPVAAALLGSGRLVNPGSHEVLGVRGEQRVRATATLAEGQTRELELRFADAGANTAPPREREREPSAAALAPTPAATRSAPLDAPAASGKSARRTWAVVALGAGGAGLAVGGVTGFLAMSKREELDDTGKCTDGCPTSLTADVNQLNTYRTVSTVAFIAGGVLAAAGITLWVTAPSPKGAQARASFGPNGLLLDGRF